MLKVQIDSSGVILLDDLGVVFLVGADGCCCMPSGCSDDMIPADCGAGGGTWLDHKTCADNLCPGACCYSDNTCADLSESDCSAAGGTFHGINVHCSDGVCCPCSTCFGEDLPSRITLSQSAHGAWASENRFTIDGDITCHLSLCDYHGGRDGDGSPCICIFGYECDGDYATHCEDGTDYSILGVGRLLIVKKFKEASCSSGFPDVPVGGWYYLFSHDFGYPVGLGSGCTLSSSLHVDTGWLGGGPMGSLSGSANLGSGDTIMNFTWGANLVDPIPCLCRKETQHNISHSENHYHYPCYGGDPPVPCTPDYGDRVTDQDITSIILYDVDGYVCHAECSGNHSNNCSGGYGCFCPPNEWEQCLWGMECSGNYILNDDGKGCHMQDDYCGPSAGCSNCVIGCGCFDCPYGTFVCTPNAGCDDGQDCSVHTCESDSCDAYCDRSQSFCNTTIVEWVHCIPCP